MDEELRKRLLQKGISIVYGFDGKPQYYKNGKMLTGKAYGDAALLHSRTSTELLNKGTLKGIVNASQSPYTQLLDPSGVSGYRDFKKTIIDKWNTSSKVDKTFAVLGALPALSLLKNAKPASKTVKTVVDINKKKIIPTAINSLKKDITSLYKKDLTFSPSAIKKAFSKPVINVTTAEEKLKDFENLTKHVVTTPYANRTKEIPVVINELRERIKNNTLLSPTQQEKIKKVIDNNNLDKNKNTAEKVKKEMYERFSSKEGETIYNNLLKNNPQLPPYEIAKENIKYSPFKSTYLPIIDNPKNNNMILNDVVFMNDFDNAHSAYDTGIASIPSYYVGKDMKSVPSITAHEVGGHHLQNYTPINGIDDVLVGLDLKTDGGTHLPFTNNNFINRKVNKLLKRDINPVDFNNLLYFKNSPSQLEKAAFASELKQEMRDAGFIYTSKPNEIGTITPEGVEAFFKHANKKELPSRMVNIVSPTSNSFKVLSKALNNIPFSVAGIGIGLGAGTALSTNNSEKYALGGTLTLNNNDNKMKYAQPKNNTVSYKNGNSSRDKNWVQTALAGAGLLTNLIGGASAQKKQKEALLQQERNALQTQFAQKQQQDAIAARDWNAEGDNGVEYYAGGGQLNSAQNSMQNFVPVQSSTMQPNLAVMGGKPASSSGFQTMGGQLIPIGKGIEKAVGNRHEESTIDGVGGIQLHDEQGFQGEIEDGEVVVDGTNILSNRLKYDKNNTYAQKMEKLTRKRNKLEKQYDSTTDKRVKAGIDRKLMGLNMGEEALFKHQELQKYVRGIEANTTFAYGGKISGSPVLNIENYIRPIVRNDGVSIKGNGFLGKIKSKYGNDMTEYTVGVNIDGKETDIPTLIPGLTSEELSYIKTEPDFNNKIGKQIIEKVVNFAKQRKSNNKSYFANFDEEGKFAFGGKIKKYAPGGVLPVPKFRKWKLDHNGKPVLDTLENDNPTTEELNKKDVDWNKSSIISTIPDITTSNYKKIEGITYDANEIADDDDYINIGREGGIDLTGKKGLNINSKDVENIAQGALSLVDNVGNMMINKNTPKVPVPLLNTAVPLKTRVNINPQLAELRRTQKANTDTILNNSSNSNNARANIVASRLATTSQINALLGEKENKETALENADAQNRQQVGMTNTALTNEYNFRNFQRTNDMQSRASQNLANLQGDIKDYFLGRKLDKQFDKKMEVEAKSGQLGETAAVLAQDKDYMSNSENRKLIREEAIRTNNKWLLEYLNRNGY